MGHSTADIFISAKDAEAAKSNTDRGFYGRMNTFESRLVQLAVEKWTYSDDWARAHDARVGAIKMTKPMSDKAAGDYLDTKSDDMRDNSYIIPIVDDSAVKHTEKTLRVEATEKEIATLRSGHFYDRILLIRSLLKSKGIEAIEYSVEKLPAARKPQAKASEGKLETRYFILQDRNQRQPKTFSSMAEVRAYGVTFLQDNPQVSRVDVGSKQVRVAENGEENEVLLSITRPEKAGIVSIKYTEEKLRSAKPKVIGYTVAFDYHH